jgi:hypothetical protein
VRLPEQLEQLLVADPRRVEHDTHGLGVAGLAGAHLLVRRVRREAALVADGGDGHARLLPIQLLLAPEAAERELRDLAAGRIRRLQADAVDEVALGGGERLVAAGERIGL